MSPACPLPSLNEQPKHDQGVNHISNQAVGEGDLLGAGKTCGDTGCRATPMRRMPTIKAAGSRRIDAPQRPGSFDMMLGVPPGRASWGLLPRGAVRSWGLLRLFRSYGLEGLVPGARPTVPGLR